MKFEEPPHVTVRIKFSTELSGLQTLGIIQAALGHKLHVFEMKWDDGPIYKIGVHSSDSYGQFLITPTYEGIPYIHETDDPLIRELVVVSYEEEENPWHMQQLGGLYNRLEAATNLVESIRRVYDEALESRDWPVWEYPGPSGHELR